MTLKVEWMKITFSASFKRAFKKIVKGNKSLERTFWEKVEIFTRDPFDRRLRTHRLSGSLKDLWSSLLFASDFLFPGKALLREMAPPLKLTELAEAKARWGLSMQAIIKKAQKEQLISDMRKKYLFQLNSAWRNPERNEAVGGVLNSRHQFGNAVDLDITRPAEGLTTAQLFCILQTAGDAVADGFAEHFGTQRVCNAADVTHVHVQQ